MKAGGRNGTIAIAPYMPPFPASPGMKQTTKDIIVPILNDTEIIKTMQECRSLENCTLGEFCPIGGSNGANIMCPSQMCCQLPSDAVPRVCRFPTFACTCPNPIDHVCDVCPGVQYCAAGTVLPVPCPAGYVCRFVLGKEGETPRIEPPVKCPLTLYCPAGSYEYFPCPAGYYCETPTIRKSAQKAIIAPRDQQNQQM